VISHVKLKKKIKANIQSENKTVVTRGRKRWDMWVRVYKVADV
jgi:hypothetical protein